MAAKKARQLLVVEVKNEGEWKDEFMWPLHSTSEMSPKLNSKQAINLHPKFKILKKNSEQNLQQINLNSELTVVKTPIHKMYIY